MFLNMVNCSKSTQRSTQHIYKGEQTTGTCGNIRESHKCYVVPKKSASEEYILCILLYELLYEVQEAKLIYYNRDHITLELG